VISAGFSRRQARFARLLPLALIRRATQAAAAFFLLAALPGCAILRAAATGGDVVAATKDSVDARGAAIDAITGDEERAVGQATAIAVIAAYGGLVLDQELVEYVNEVGNAVARQGERKVRRKTGEARIASRRIFVGVLDDKRINAFGLPGGYVLVTRGLLENLQSESELAWVLGHEMAHCDYEHGLAALKTQMGTGAFVKGSTKTGIADKAVFGRIADWYADFIVTRGFDKKAEKDADALGLEYSTKAGYDALGAWRVLTILDVAEKADAAATAKKDASHESPVVRYGHLRAAIGAKKGLGTMGAVRYDESCLRKLEAYSVAKAP